MDGPAPRMRSDGMPDWRFAFLTRDKVQIEDTWDAIGLRGTGSHHLSISEQTVPEEHLAAVMFEPARHDGPLWRLPLLTMASLVMAGFPLGVARRALNEFTEYAQTKARGGGLQTVAEDGFAQAELARAEGEVRAARSFVYDAAGELWDACLTGDPPGVDARGTMLLATTNAMRAAVAAVDRVFRLSGASAVFSDQPLARCFRDLHTANEHIIYSDGRDQAYIKTIFGIETPTFMI